MTPNPPARGWDVVVVGSGFGGTMAAHELVRAGLRVLMLEQGDWIAPGPHNRAWPVRWTKRPGYSLETPYQVEGESSKSIGSFQCVGGTSVFYGGVGLRMREADFRGSAEVTGGVRWPLDYRDLQPHYGAVERMLGICGDDRADVTRPPRMVPLPRPSDPLSPTSRSIALSAHRLGLSPFRVPVAISRGGPSNRICEAHCGQCDGFPCSGKNDLASAVLPELLDEGLTLRTDTVVCRLDADRGRIEAVRAVDRRTGQELLFQGDQVVLAAGALATPHLLLGSGLDGLSPARDAVGRYLMRHCSGVVFGGAPSSIGDPDDGRKQIGIHDFYFGDPRGNGAMGKLGAIQQLRGVRIALAMARLPGSLREALYPFLSRLVGFIVMAEDQPVSENRVYLDEAEVDRFGRPVARVHHRHTVRDLRARRALATRAADVLREANVSFPFTLPIRTFSHALGTVRMGHDPRHFPVAPDGRYRGVDNLWITDASVFPTAAAVNPSLTIAANARRIAIEMIGASEAATGARGVDRSEVVGEKLSTTTDTPAP